MIYDRLSAIEEIRSLTEIANKALSKSMRRVIEDYFYEKFGVQELWVNQICDSLFVPRRYLNPKRFLDLLIERWQFYGLTSREIRQHLERWHHEFSAKRHRAYGQAVLDALARLPSQP